MCKASFSAAEVCDIIERGCVVYPTIGARVYTGIDGQVNCTYMQSGSVTSEQGIQRTQEVSNVEPRRTRVPN